MHCFVRNDTEKKEKLRKHLYESVKSARRNVFMKNPKLLALPQVAVGVGTVGARCGRGTSVVCRLGRASCACS